MQAASGIDVGRSGQQVFRTHAHQQRAGHPRRTLHPQSGDLGRVGRQFHQVHRRGPDEPGDEGVHRIVVELRRAVDLLQLAVLQHRHPVTHGHRLDLVVGDVHGGDAQVVLQFHDLRTGLHAEFRVQVRQRLVHEEHLRFPHDRPAHRHTLTLATGEVLRLSVQVVAQVQQVGGVVDALLDLGLGALGDGQGEAHVLPHRHVRVQRVVLEDHRDVPVARLDTGDVAATDGDRPGAGGLQSCQGAQDGGLTAARRTDQHEELAVTDGEVEVWDGGGGGTRVADVHVLEDDVSHGGESYRRTMGRRWRLP